MLEVDSLSITRSRRRVLVDVSFSLGPGVSVLLGPNGAGKTTLLRALVDPHPKAKTAITIASSEATVERRTSDRRTRNANVGYMPQEWRYFSGYRVRECVEYAAWLKGIPSADLDRRAREALAFVNLTDVADRRVSRLSGGQQRRVGLAEAIVHSPRILLLDEPTVGLDPAQRNEFLSLLSDRHQSTVLLSTHIISDVADIAGQVIVLCDGKVAFSGTTEKLADGAPRGLSFERQLEWGYLRATGQQLRAP